MPSTPLSTAANGKIELSPNKATTKLLKELSIPESLQPLVVESISIHEQFDQDTIHKQSFHNRHHIAATLKAGLIAVDVAIDAEKQGNTDDPFLLEAELEEYNLVCETSLDLQDLRVAMILACATHDLGNTSHTITEKNCFLFHQARPTQNQETVNIYTASGAEATSAYICGHLAEYHFPESPPEDIAHPDRFEQIVDLAKAIIEQTIFYPNLQETGIPFALQARLIDQIGQACFNPNGLAATAGLLTEQFIEFRQITTEALENSHLEQDRLAILKTPLPNRIILENLDSYPELIKIDNELNKHPHIQYFIDFYHKQTEILMDIFGIGDKKQTLFQKAIQTHWGPPKNQKQITKMLEKLGKKPVYMPRLQAASFILENLS